MAAESLEARTLLAAVGWDGDAGSLNWNDATNWSDDVLPEAGDDVTIGAAFGGSTIVSTANVNVNSIISDAVLRLNSGTVTVATLTHAHGGLIMAGGTLSGSTLDTGSNTVIATTSGGTLDGVTIDADIDMTQFNNASLRLKDSVLNSTVNVGSTANSWYARLYIGDSSATAGTLAGTGDILFGNSGNNAVYNYSSGSGAAGVLTIAPGITIHGKTGVVTNSYGSGTIVNEGTIGPDVAGGTLTLGTTGTWRSSGTIAVSDGTLNLGGTFTQPDVFVRTGGVVNVTGVLRDGLELDATTGSWRMAVPPAVTSIDPVVVARL